MNPLTSEWVALNVLSSYAVETRYPGESATKEEAREALAHCRQIRSLVRQGLDLRPERKTAAPPKRRRKTRGKR